MERLLHVFKVLEVTCFLCEKLSQDPLEKFLGVKSNCTEQMTTTQHMSS